MVDTPLRTAQDVFKRQGGVATRQQLRRLGVRPGETRSRLRTGEWESVGRQVIRLVGAPRGPEQDLWAAWLAAGSSAVVSHGSAAWLHDLLPAPPRPVLTLPFGATNRIPGAVVHRPTRVADRIVVRRGLPCADVPRTIVDLAGELAPSALDDLVDRAMARRKATVPALLGEVRRSAKQGRVGPAVLRASLERRGFLGAPEPSVLESRFARLLAGAGISVTGFEVRVGPGGRYRVDTRLSRTVYAEVDGHAYHASPEQKSRDERRRNRLRLEGRTILVYTWRDVVHDGQRVVAEIRDALANERDAI